MKEKNDSHHTAPVITIDGPSGSGKGTISLMLAGHLGWHFLDSGAIYRAIAWAVSHYEVSPADEAKLQSLLQRIQLVIESQQPNDTARISCDGHDITVAIRSEACGIMASKTSSLPMVREAVLSYQRDFQRPPGLIADGRDMGTVVFPHAVLKFFFEADPNERANRRYRQLQDKGISVSLRDIQEDLVERDRRDRERQISPAKPAVDALVIDTTNLGIDQVFAEVIRVVEQRMLK